MKGIALSISDIPIYIQSDKALIIDLVEQDFAGFVSKNNAYPELKIRVIIQDSCKHTNPYLYGNPHKLSLFRDQNNLYIKGGVYRGVFNRKNRTCEIRQGVSIQPLYLFLRNILSIYLPEKDGFLIHAASISSNKKGYLFPGRPQTGKSTIARLSLSLKQVLSDDFSIIRRVKNEFCVFSSPFWGHVEVHGKNQIGQEKTNSVAIDSLYFPIQDKKTYKEKLPFKQAFLQLIRNICLFNENKRASDKILGLTYEVTKKTPVYLLHFTLDNNFWRCIEND